MINIRRDILTPLSLLLLGWSASSCTTEEFKDQINSGDGVPTLGISIGVSGPTRAATDGTFEPGSDLENHLDIKGNDYRIYFFSEENKYIATFNPDIKAQSSETPETVNGVNTYYYSFEGKVPAGVGTNFKLVVFANWGKYPEEAANKADGEYKLVKDVTTITELVTHTDAQFNHLSSPGEGEWLDEDQHRLIPFYGVRHYDISNFEDVKNNIKDGHLIGDVRVNLTTNELALPLIRAMARVEIILNNKHASFSSVKMTKVNDKGFNSPYKKGDNWEFDYTDYFHDYTWGDDFVRGVHLVEGENDKDQKELEFKKVSSRTETPEKWVAYVPEYKNIGVGDGYTAIEVTLANPDSESEGWASPTKTIYFATDGTAANNENDVEATKTDPGRYDIERNNIYRFTIDDMNANMECQLDVQPYAEQRLEVDLGLMRDESGDLMVVPDGEGNLPDFFKEYMKYHADKWPIYTNGSMAVRLEPEVAGDYYAIKLGSDGDIKNAEVLLKDSDGCQVLTTFGEREDNLDNCSTREVYDYTTGTTYHKDHDGDQRLQHNSDHSSIVLDHDKTMYYKSDPLSNPVLRYRVESWEEPSKETDPGTFYYWKTISQPYAVSEDRLKEELRVDEIPEEYKFLLNKDKDSEGNFTVVKMAVTITLWDGNKANPENGSDAGIILEEYTDEIAKILSSNSVYKLTD